MRHLPRVVLSVLAIAFLPAPAAHGVTINEYPLPASAPASDIVGVSVAKDGSPWAALASACGCGNGDQDPGRLMRLDTASGNWTLVGTRVPPASMFPPFSNGKILFTMGATGLAPGVAGVLDPAARTATEVPELGRLGGGSFGGDALWFVQSRPYGTPASEPSVLRRITPSGPTDFPLPAGVAPYAIAAAPDGSVWAIEGALSAATQAEHERRWLTHTTADGTRTSFPLNLGPNGTKQVAMAAGTGVVWITTSEGADATTGDVVRVDPTSGATQTFNLAIPGPVASMVADRQDRLWYLYHDTPLIARFDPATRSDVRYAMPNRIGHPRNLVLAEDGSFWYSILPESGKGLMPALGRVSLAGTSVQVPAAVAIGQGITAGVTCATACTAVGRLTTKVPVSRAGASAAAVRTRTVKLGTGSARLKRAGSGSIVVKLTPAGRSRLRAHKGKTLSALLTTTRTEGKRKRVSRSRVKIATRKVTVGGG